MATISKDLSDYKKLNISFRKTIKIGLVVSEWNGDVTLSLFKACKQTLLDNGLQEKNIKKFNVPGSYELVFASNKIVKKLNFDAIIAIGSIIRGETPHFEYICKAVSNGIQKINTTSNIPVIFGVLTDNDIQQAKDRSGGKYGNKGVELAISCLKMIVLNRKLNQ